MKLSVKTWVLIIFLVFSLYFIFSFKDLFTTSGVYVKFVEKNTSLSDQGLTVGEIILTVNGQTIKNVSDFQNSMSLLSDKQMNKLDIQTNKQEIIGLFNSSIKNQIIVSERSGIRIKTGLDIQGGARALITAKNHSLTDSELTDLISISQERFNLVGLSDLNIKKASDMQGNNFMIIEIAGSTPKDLEDLILQQGKFEGKIGNETIFTGGKDIAHVERSGQQSGIEGCSSTSSGEVCRFRFPISLTEEAAKRQAAVTGNLSISTEDPGYLSQKLDLYIDGKLADSLYISKDLKGQITTQISIQGSGTGKDRASAVVDAETNMKKLQTILITGSLPYQLEISKLDTISPVLGKSFTEAILIGGLFAMLAVSIIIFLRYRNIKISLALLFTSFSELVIILGFAALIKWNLDLPSIAGIIATIGTGVDSQIVILDESRFKVDSLKERIKKALFIIFTSFATAFVSLVPLTGLFQFMGIGAAGAGLLKGFAITTLIGITAGVFITRPAFADIIKRIEDHN